MRLVARTLVLFTVCGAAQPAAQAAAAHLSKAKILYQANFSRGASGWQTGGDGNWFVRSGILRANAGTSYDGTLVAAPYRVRSSNYSVSAKMRVAVWKSDASLPEFGVAIRLPNGTLSPGTDSSGLVGGVVSFGERTAGIYTPGGAGAARFYQNRPPYDPRNNWHKVQLQVRGNSIKLLIDGNEATHVNSNLSFSNARVGLFANGVRLQVATFRVISG
jgi:hypothetical protein